MTVRETEGPGIVKGGSEIYGIVLEGSEVPETIKRGSISHSDSGVFCKLNKMVRH